MRTIPPFLSLASLGSGVTAVIASVDLHSASVIASSLATIFAGVISILRGSRKTKTKGRRVRVVRPSASAATTDTK